MEAVHSNSDNPVETGASPRSTVLLTTASMTSEVSSMNKSNMASGLGTPEGKVTAASSSSSAKEGPEAEEVNPAAAVSNDPKTGRGDGKDASALGRTENVLNVGSARQDTTPSGGFYSGYPGGAPPSPINANAYETVPGPFGQAGGGFVAAHTSPFGVPTGATTPLSPPRTTASMVSVPPSPLFPRISSGGLEGASPGLPIHQMTPQSPGLPYTMSLGSSSPYTSYAATARMASQASSSSDDGNWDRNTQNPTTYPSPQANVYGVLDRGVALRSYSVDSDSMLPPAMLDPHDQANPAYSPYSSGPTSSPAGNMFAPQQAWSYPGTLPDMYSAPGSPLQPRPSVHHPPTMHMYPAMRPMGSPYNHAMPYYQATSPGPPIQTTASNKGPDGANLFIFHIPNHFTNIDMFNLFCAYGNLLSVRIMVEKDTGRSRGFGFVSYDNAESAALAIKELNGYAIGNKRLKVQHKQIRQRDVHDREGGGQYGDHGGGGFASSLPPSGPSASAPADNNNISSWYQGHEPNDPNAAPSAAVSHVLPGGNAEAFGDEIPKETAPAEDVAAEASSPLASIGALQGALPEVSSIPQQE